ncbi:MAG: ROK family glucokinase [Lachnospiraceae bacterium]|jgi:glucokinase|nr:ROK family glucokinase [Lachnospiraceae bacterium]RKJ49735.1 ROK family protein [bacterium 1XD42-54]
MEKYCFGIDVGGTTVKCGLFTVEGDVLDKWEIKTRVEDNGVAILPDIAETIEKKLLEKGIDKDEVAGIGIGIPGPVNEKGEIPCAVNLHWGYVDIVGDMERLTGLKVKAGNDANVAALGELWQGGGTGCHNMILVTLGTGVGGGIIIDDKIVVGAHGAGGEIGHAHVEDAVTDQCNCGNCGCLEQLTSATGIVRLAKEAVAASDTPSVLRGSRISAKSVWDAVKEGDALAIQIAERFGTYLGKTLAVFATVSDPEVIVIGGGVSKAGPILLDYIMKPFRKYAFTACRDTKFALAQLGNDAGIFGAAKMVL